MSTYHPTNERNDYKNRYRRDMSTVMEKLYEAGPYAIGFVAFVITLGSLLSLAAFDPVVGMFSAEYALGGNRLAAGFTSLATSGLALGLVGTCFYGWRERWSMWVLLPLIVVSLVPASIDVYFDGMAPDIIRFGHFIIPSQHFGVDSPDILPHNLYRVMFGALSAVGEPLTAASVIIFPVLKDLLRGVFSR